MRNRCAQVKLQLSRTDGPVKSLTGEIFAVLELCRANGELLTELASGVSLPCNKTAPRPSGTVGGADLWTLRSDFVWGAFWTLLLPPGTAVVRFCVHRSLIFTEPLLGARRR